MQKNSVVISVQAELRDFAFTNLALIFEVRFLMFSNPGSTHFTKKNYIDLDMDIAKKAARIGMKAAENGTW